MEWYQIAENPKALTSLYRVVPSLDSVELYQVVLHEDGPAVSLQFSLPEMPDPIPRRWQERKADRVQVEISLFAVYDFTMQGWSTASRSRQSVWQRKTRWRSR